MEPLLCQVSLARENPTHLPGHSQHAPALASARVCLRRLPIAVQTCLCDSPNNPGAGSGRATGPVLATPQRSRPRGVPGPSAPPCPLGAHGAGRLVPGRGARYSQSRPGPARPPGSASRTHSAFPPYLPAAPPSPARKFRATPSPRARRLARSQACRHPAPPEHRLFRLQSCQLRGADAGVGTALRSRCERRWLLGALHRPWTALQAPPPTVPASFKYSEFGTNAGSDPRIRVFFFFTDP